MQISVVASPVRDIEDELLLVSLLENTPPRSHLLRDLDEALEGQIVQLLETGDFRGGFLQTQILYPRGAVKSRRVMVVGLGPESEISLERLRQASAFATRKIIDLGLTGFTSMTHGITLEDFQPGVLARALVEGATIAAHRLDVFRTQGQSRVHDLERIQIVTSRPEIAAELMRGAREGIIHALAANFAYDVIAYPSNLMNAARIEVLAQSIRDAAVEEGLADKFSVTILHEPELRAEGCGGILAVGQGSDNPPSMVVLDYRGGEPGERPLALVGKGITFDSGGLSLKTAESMEHAKHDKTGAGVVLAVVRAAIRLRLPLNLIGIVPLAENMPGGSAMRPGDIINMASGLTVEIVSTDAEGRLLLGDALHYVQRFNPAAVIDLATLTGTVRRTFGQDAIGILGNSGRLMALLIASGEITNERAWPLPLWEVYAGQNASQMADLRNAGGPNAGTITAAKFLQRFVGSFAWAHMDVSGAVSANGNGSASSAYILKGPAGAGVRLLLHFLRTVSTLKETGTQLDQFLTLSREEMAEGRIPGVTEREANVSLLALASDLTLVSRLLCGNNCVS